jgi:Kef-type K+ transport system membrane component KefB/mannitol/fructose-specific phosphotransferase system IIA component (Ntr-type)
MNNFTRHEIVILFISLGFMLGAGKLFGELFRRMKLPPIIGEILAGIVIGRSLMGRIAPDFYEWMFRTGSRSETGLDSFILLGMVLLLLVAGLEVDLSSVIRQGRSVFWMSSCTILIPLAAGTALPVLFPGLFPGGDNTRILPLFTGVALAISALPVIARILLDTGLFHSDFGMLVLASATINDLVGWLIFSIIMQLAVSGAVNALAVAQTTGITLIFALLILTVVRSLINNALPWVKANTEWPGGVIVFVVITGLIFSSASEAIGVHAIFGAFLAGIAIGDSPHLREHTREIINQFASNIFAPLFFVSIGLRIDFVTNFNPILTLVITLLAFATKLGGAAAGGLLSRMPLRASLPVGAALSARGAMEIILGLYAMKYAVISEETFVSIVVMALATSLISAPLIRVFFKTEKKLSLMDLLETRLFIPALDADSPEGAIRRLAAAAALKTGLADSLIAVKVIEREMMMSTGLGEEIAVPHARMEDITQPCLAVAISPEGIDFNAPDGEPARLIFMILSPANDQNSQIQILAQISRIFGNQDIKRLALQARNFVEFVAAIKPGLARADGA